MIALLHMTCSNISNKYEFHSTTIFQILGDITIRMFGIMNYNLALKNGTSNLSADWIC